MFTNLETLTEYLKFFACLLAIVNPIGAVPVFINLTAGQSREQRHRTGRVAARIGFLLGRTGINIVTRTMGLIMAAIGVEFIANGLKQLFPVLSSAVR